jgi:excisionase family DNA binding protein
METPSDEILNTKESAAYLKVSQSTIRNLVLREQLKAVRVGIRIVRFRKSDLDALLTPLANGEYSVWNRK